MTKQRMAMRSNFPWSDFKKLGTPELSSSSSTSTALSPKNFEKRAHPIVQYQPDLRIVLGSYTECGPYGRWPQVEYVAIINKP